MALKHSSEIFVKFSNYEQFQNTVLKPSKNIQFLVADDYTVFKALYTHNDYRLLQQDINEIRDWSKNNKLEFNKSTNVP